MLRTKVSSDYVQLEIKIYIAKVGIFFLKIMFNNGAKFVGLCAHPIKSKIIFSIRALHLLQIRIYIRSALSEISISHQ